MDQRGHFERGLSRFGATVRFRIEAPRFGLGDGLDYQYFVNDRHPGFNRNLHQSVRDRTSDVFRVKRFALPDHTQTDNRGRTPLRRLRERRRRERDLEGTGHADNLRVHDARRA